MSIIYLAPHLDDVALSCGGLVWMQAQAGEPISIWTICAGDPPKGSLSSFAQKHHDRWKLPQDAAAARRKEDTLSCQLLGASWEHFPVPDAIYRRRPHSNDSLYTSDERLFGPLHPAEQTLVQQVAGWLEQRLLPEDRLVVPLTLGNHVDHQLTRQAAELIQNPSSYYFDFPYTEDNEHAVIRSVPEGYLLEIHAVSNLAMAAWEESVAAHHSQISTFWENEESMQEALRAYSQSNQGIRVWNPGI